MNVGVFFATIALVGGTLWSGDGERIEGATILIEGERIVQVGHKIPIPTGARVKECHGLVITPGLIDAYTQLGLVEISGVRGTNDTYPKTKSEIRAHLRAADGVNPNSAVLAHQVDYGLLSAGVHVSGGLLSGQLTAIDLPSGQVHRHFGGVNTRLGGLNEQSRVQRIAELNEAFEQTKNWIRTRRISNRPEQLPERELRVLARLLNGKGRLFVEAHRQSDIEQALQLGKKFGIRIVIVGGQEAWRVADQLVTDNAAVIMNPVANAPGNFDKLFTRPNSISFLLSRGVNVAISTLSTHHARKLRQWAGNAVRGGLAYPAAIRAITVTPAQLLDLPKRKGVRPGQVADLVVWSGDPLELSSFPTLRISRGAVVDLKTRQRELFKRYRCIGSHQEKCSPAPKK